MAERARGQDHLFTMVAGGDVVEEFVVQDLTVEAIQGVDSQRYMGEGANRFDETFEGYKLTCMGHAEGSGARGVLAVFEKSTMRARRKLSGFKIQSSGILIWPDGRQSRASFHDLRIENPQYQVKGNELVSFSFTAYCSEGKLAKL